MIKVDKLLRIKRKTISITIDKNGEVLVKAPINLPISKIESFILSKEKWIEKNQSTILLRKKMNEDFTSYNKIIFCGKIYDLVVSNNKKIIIENQNMYVNQNWDYRKKLLKIVKFLKEKFEEIIFSRLTYWTNFMQLAPHNVKQTNAKTKWGSCSSKREIMFNWRMVMLSPKLIDYIIVHELAHLIELNHSSAFWAIVNAVLPDFKLLRQDLKQCNFILELFRNFDENTL